MTQWKVSGPKGIFVLDLIQFARLQSKLALSNRDSASDAQIRNTNLKLGLLSYPVLQAADILLYG